MTYVAHGAFSAKGYNNASSDLQRNCRTFLGADCEAGDRHPSRWPNRPSDARRQRKYEYSLPQTDAFFRGTRAQPLAHKAEVPVQGSM